MDPVHFLQIWIEPDERGVDPEYAEKSFGRIEPGALQLIASKGGRHDSISIHQNADMYVAKLGAGRGIDHAFAPSRSGWVQVIGGALTINGKRLEAGDGAAVKDAATLRFLAENDAHFLFFDLQ